ncbi:MAG: PAS domain S-box protein [Nitrososphaeria archaeon]
MKASEERFRSVADAAPDALVCFDRQGRIFLWNKAAEDVFGYSAAEAIGRSVTLLLTVKHGESFVNRLKMWSSAENPSPKGVFRWLRRGRTAAYFPLEYRFRDGKRVMKSSSQPL